MNNLEKKYIELCNRKSDINEHLPTLKKYTEQCETIVEMGVRYIVSTYAFMMGMPKKITSIDIKHPKEYGGKIDDVVTLAKENNIDFEFILGDTRIIEIEETDLLFIDTWHIYDQLKIELENHSNKVRKYIILHDTTLFEFNGEGFGYLGLWPAIEEFLKNNNKWIICERYVNNNGLTILKRI
jgi:hypothetical protein